MGRRCFGGLYKQTTVTIKVASSDSANRETSQSNYGGFNYQPHKNFALHHDDIGDLRRRSTRSYGYFRHYFFMAFLMPTASIWADNIFGRVGGPPKYVD